MSTDPQDGRRDCVCPIARHRHGTALAYNVDGCHCTDCTEAIRVHQAAYRKRVAAARWNGRPATVDGTVMRQQLRSLAALGWTATELAKRLHVTPQAVCQLRVQDGKARATTVDRVNALHAELGARLPSPWTWACERTSRIAIVKHGWAFPSADDPIIDAGDDVDEVAVTEAMAGRRVHLTRAEKQEATRRLTARGMSARLIGERLGVSDRTVVRKRAAA